MRKVSGGLISTIAGTGISGYTGDGGAATSAQLNGLHSLAFDPMGNLYIVEDNDVRMILANQTSITTYAGSSTPGFSGDGGASMSARFNGLSGMTFDSYAGGYNAYLVDTGNLRVRTISIAPNRVLTHAGNGTIDAEFSNVPSHVNLLTPNSIATPSTGGATFSDIGSSTIRNLISSSAGVWNLSLVAGTGLPVYSPDLSKPTSPLSFPTGLAYDANDVLYFIEGNRIRKLENGYYSTVANGSNTAGFSGDGGLASAAQFNSPSSLAIASNGDVYIADSLNNRVRVIDKKTGIVTTISGTGAADSTGDGGLATSAALNDPVGVGLDGLGNLYVCEFAGNRVRKIELNSNYITTAAGDGTTSLTGLWGPTSVAADQAGNLFIADQQHFRVVRVVSGINRMTTIVGDGLSSTLYPVAVALARFPPSDADHGYSLYVTDAFGYIKVATPVVCFYTASNPFVYAGNSASSGSVTFTATNVSCPAPPVLSNSPYVTITGNTMSNGVGTVSFTVSANAGLARTGTVSIAGQALSIVQAGTIGQQNVGYFQPTNGPIYALDANGNGVSDGPPGDKVFNFLGQAGDIAVAGDWNHDGRTKVGVYRNGYWILDYNGNGVWDDVAGGDKFYGFGDAGYTPIVGDWNGDGRTKIGFYYNGFWALDMDGDGSFTAADKFFGFGGNGSGEVPIVGDWNGDGRTKIGFYFNGTWALDYNGDGVFNLATDKYFTQFTYLAGDKPVVGDWNGDGKAKIGIYRGGQWVLDANNNGLVDSGDKFPAFGGGSGDVPIIADWNGSGTSKIGTYNNGHWALDYNGDGTYDSGDRIIGFGGTAGNQPLIGRW